MLIPCNCCKGNRDASVYIRITLPQLIIGECGLLRVASLFGVMQLKIISFRRAKIITFLISFFIFILFTSCTLATFSKCTEIFDNERKNNNVSYKYLKLNMAI